MTLAEAKKLSAQQLAERLLGAAGASGGYVEADVRGDGGIMYHMPGLNVVSLFKEPKSSGNPGICMVEGTRIEFETSELNTYGDPPHRVRDFYKMVFFAILSPTGSPAGSFDDVRQNAACAKLGPVVGAREPLWFALPSDSSNEAHFAMRAVVKAQAGVAQLGAALTCKADDATCIDPAAAVAAVPIRRIYLMEVKRCEDPRAWCVHAIWEKWSNGKDSRRVELDIRTDAAKVDWGAEFRVVGIDITSGVWIAD